MSYPNHLPSQYANTAIVMAYNARGLGYFLDELAERPQTVLLEADAHMIGQGLLAVIDTLAVETGNRPFVAGQEELLRRKGKLFESALEGPKEVSAFITSDPQDIYPRLTVEVANQDEVGSTYAYPLEPEDALQVDHEAREAALVIAGYTRWETVCRKGRYSVCPPLNPRAAIFSDPPRFEPTGTY